MKRYFTLKRILFLLLLVNSSNLQVVAQKSKDDGPPIVTLFNGNIINPLPYHRNFFIEGDLPVLGKWQIEKVTIQIYEIGDKRKSKEFEKKSDKEKERTFSEMPPYVKDEWLKVNDESKMKFFVSKGLKFNIYYYFRIKYYINFKITNQEDINAFYEDVKTELSKYGNENIKERSDNLRKSEMKDIILDRYKRFIFNAYLKYSLPNQILKKPEDTITNNFIESFEQTFTEEKIDGFCQDFSQYYYILKYIEDKEYPVQINDIDFKIKVLTDSLPKVPDSSREKLKKQIKELKTEMDKLISLKNKSETEKNKSENGMKKFFSDDFKPYIKDIISSDDIVTAGIATVQDLETVRIGTVFGGGATWLNAGNDSYPVGFGYVGLKFFFYPVDKRLIDPYLGSNPTFNRLSFLVGFAINSDNMQYHGQDLSPLVLNTFPMLGLSYDFNRYFGIDVGGMFFMYDDISELKSSSILRASPFVTLSFDIDLFNRFKNLFQGQPYSIKDIGSVPSK